MKGCPKNFPLFKIILKVVLYYYLVKIDSSILIRIKKFSSKKLHIYSTKQTIL